MTDTIILAQQLDLSGVKTYRPGTVSLGRDPNPTFWERLVHDPSAVMMVGLVVVVMIVLLIMLRRGKG